MARPTIKISDETLDAVQRTLHLAIPKRAGDYIEGDPYPNKAVVTKKGVMRFEQWATMRLKTPTRSILAWVEGFHLSGIVDSNIPKSGKGKSFWVLCFNKLFMD